jgi:hypothetical protein
MSVKKIVEPRPFRPFQVDKYWVDGEVGRGSFATVYRGKHEVIFFLFIMFLCCYYSV